MSIKLNGATSGSIELDVPAAVTGGDISLTLPNGLKSMQVFTSTGTSTWTKPSGITRVKVYVTGGGGGGGPTNQDDMSNGGGAGGTAIELIDVTSVSSVTVTVGVGGIGAPNDTQTDATGGTSSFGSYCSASGGHRYSLSWAIGGAGGIATGGDINISGSDGCGGLIDNNGGLQAAGSGGASFWGQGGRGGVRNYNNAGNDGTAFGSGGGGGADSEGGNDGAPGIVVVEEYG